VAAASRKKNSARKASSRKGGRRKGLSNKSSAANQAGFVAEGLRAVMGALVTVVVVVFSAVKLTFEKAFVGLRGERARQPIGMTLAAVSIFTFAALVDYQTGAVSDNICGTVGYATANMLLNFFGLGAFLIPAFGAFWGIARLVRESESNALLKCIGVFTLALTVGTIAAGFSPNSLPSDGFPYGRGGWFGHSVFPSLAETLGAFGSSVLLTLLGLVASLLATEWAFVPLVKELLRRGRDGLVQGKLPLGESKGLVDEASQNKDKAFRGLRRFWAYVIGANQPYTPGGETATPATTAGAGESSSIPSNLSPPTAVEPPPTVKPAAQPAAPEAQTSKPGATTLPISKPVSPSKPNPAATAESGANTDEATSGPLPGISDGPSLGHENTAKEEAPAKRRRRATPQLKSLPPISLLSEGQVVDRSKMQAEIDSSGRRLQACFDAFNLDARVVGAERGPTLTLFEVKLGEGVSVRKLKNAREDIGVQLGSHGVRIVFPLPGRTTVGIEVPNLIRESVFLKDVYLQANTKKSRLPMVIGRDTLGKPVVEDLTAMPHMLVAGTTGSGKSVCLNSILMTLLLTQGPELLRLILIDPKQVELQLYADIPHLACPVVTDMKRAPGVLEWSVRNMEDRLHLFKLAGVRNIADYNALGVSGLKERLGEDYDSEETPDSMPFIVLVIDELADLMMVSAKEVEIAISRLAAKARAAGIHLLVATQRPSTDVVTGLIKMNLPVRIAFKVTSGVDSRVILDDSGADMLLGNGDFLYRPPGAAGMTRGQGAFVEEQEVRAACDHLRANGKPEYIEDLVQLKSTGGAGTSEVDDPLFDDAVRIILQSGRGSASLLQRALSVGYTRASRLIDIMTEQGVLGPFIGSKAREVLLSLEEWEAQKIGK